MTTFSLSLQLKICFLVCALPFFFACKATKQGDVSAKKVFPVRIILTETASYCGGAAPPQAMLDELRTPKALKDKNIYVRKGSTNDPSSDHFEFVGKSNSDGIVEFKLPSGNYILVFDEKKDTAFRDQLLLEYGEASKNYEAIDRSCLNQWLREPELAFQIQGDGYVATLNVHRPCERNAVPCAEYRGPMPP